MNLDCYQLDTPYPSICVQEPNRIYARYILDNVGGRNSEMTAIASYFYNTLKITNSSIVDVFAGIQIVEMHHLEIFGEMAMQLGENPLLWTNCGRNRVWWSPSYTDYPSSLTGILESSIEGESGAIEKYNWQIEHIDDDNVQANLRRIIQDEELHLKLFRELYEEYC